ncbi:MAG: nicotinamide riboside transporter PnuC [Sulfurovum sp.]|nr:MAG: nicotinamide riboside transporter PnuC [Sulfurovum sp.]
MSFQNSIDAFMAMSMWEIVATLLGIAYVILAAKESQWAWPFAFLSTLIYTILFWEGALVSSSILNFYYMIMAVYGYLLWRKDAQGKRLHVTKWHGTKLFKIIALGLIFSCIVGYLSDTYAGARYAYLDAFVMVFSVIATWMLTQKILENWLLWVVTDAAAVVLYWKSGYYATIVLFMLYVILAIYGYITWRKAYEKHQYL